MNSRFLIFFTFVFFAFACSSSDPAPPVIMDPDENGTGNDDDNGNDDGSNDNTDDVVGGVIDDDYYFAYMFIPFNTLVRPERDKLITLERNSDNLVVRRNGGFREVSSSTGFDHEYMNDLFDLVSYDANTIVLERQTSGTYSLPDFKRTITTDGNKLVSKLIQRSDPESEETVFYEYTGELLTRSYINPAETEVFYYYNDMNNLDSIVTQDYFPDGTKDGRIVERFFDYDSFPNAAKDLFMFEEIFIRSLSANNFRQYSRIRYLDNGSQASTPVEIAWDFVFDSEGRIIWNQFND